jgi:DNA-binding MarR family transcriptional regulator
MMLDRVKLFEELIESFHAIRHKLVLESNSFNDGHISLSQLIVLRIVSKYDGTSIKEISSKLCITSSAVTQLVNGLVNKGYLKREGSLEDRRSLRIFLSGPGKAIIDTLRSNGMEKLFSIFNALDDEELVKYCELNKKIVDNLLGGQPVPSHLAGHTLFGKGDPNKK